jgi:phosphohistidine phosphatase
MKTLLLIRHAKSSWNDASLPDRDRPLAPRGERDAAKMSQRLSQRHVDPDLMMCSPAVRALETARIIATGLAYKRERIAVENRLYAASMDTLIEVIESLDDALDCVMLVGHNPECSALAHHFCAEITHMPTCAIAEFRFDAKKWFGIGDANPVRTAFDWPKNESG